MQHDERHVPLIKDQETHGNSFIKDRLPEEDLQPSEKRNDAYVLIQGARVSSMQVN